MYNVKGEVSALRLENKQYIFVCLFVPLTSIPKEVRREGRVLPFTKVHMPQTCHYILPISFLLIFLPIFFLIHIFSTHFCCPFSVHSFPVYIVSCPYIFLPYNGFRLVHESLNTCHFISVTPPLTPLTPLTPHDRYISKGKEKRKEKIKEREKMGRGRKGKGERENEGKNKVFNFKALSRWFQALLLLSLALLTYKYKPGE